MSESFNKVESFIKNYCSKTESLITLDDIENYSDQKLEAVLTTGKFMVSISVLSDLTYDLTVVEFESEAVTMSKTKSSNDAEELFKELEADFEKIQHL